MRQPAPVSRAQANVKIRVIQDLAGRTREIQDLIAQRTYHLYKYGARRQGDASEEWLSDWMQAETEILSPVLVGFHESAVTLVVELGVPGFSVRDLELSMDPTCLAISGKRNSPDPSASLQVFRVVSLPVEVDPSRMAATFANGVLKLSIPKKTESAGRERENHFDLPAKTKLAALASSALLLLGTFHPSSNC